MNKVLRAFVCLVFVIPCIVHAAQDDFNLDGYKYLALVQIDMNGEMAKKGEITVPYYLTFVHNPEAGRISGSMVRTDLLLDEKDKPTAFGFSHLSVINIKIRKGKKIKFDVAQNETTIMKKVRGTFNENRDSVILALRNKANKKKKQTFIRTVHPNAGIYLGNMKAEATPSAKYYPRTGNTVVGLLITSTYPVSTAGDKVGEYSIAGLQYIKNMYYGKGTLYDAGSYYWGQNTTSKRIDVEVDYSGKKLGEFRTIYQSQDASGNLTNMGGNGKDPKFPDANRAQVKREGNKVVVIMPNPQHVDPGFTAFFIGNLLVGGNVKADFQDTWINDNGKVVEEENIRCVFDVPADFDGRVTIDITNPNDDRGSFTVEVPQSS